MWTFLTIGCLFNNKNIFSFVSPLKAEKFYTYKDIFVIDVERAISK